MTRILPIVCLALIGFSTGSVADAKRADEAANPKGEIQQVIQQQLDAFRQNDFKTAYGFAHSGVKVQFTQLDFEKMVRAGFPTMLNPGEIGFGASHEDGAKAAAQVILSGKNGKSAAYQYLLGKEDGSWRISAVIPVELEATGIQV